MLKHPDALQKFKLAFFLISVGAMQRVEEIKEKRQAQFIRDRQKKAKLIEREKDAREVKRDMALIRSPAAGMKRVAKEMEVDENEVFVHYFIAKLFD